MKLSFELLELPLEFTFTISRSSSTHAKTILVKLEHEEYIAYGEAVFTKFYGEDENTVSDFYQNLISEKTLENLNPFDIVEFERLMSKYNGNTAAKAGLDIALYDLRGRILGVPVYRLFDLDPQQCPKTSYTIGIADIDTITTKVQTALSRGYDILKVKLGTKEDLETIKHIRKLAPDATIRVDANAAWDLASAMDIIQRIVKYNIEFVEEPLTLGSPESAYQELYKNSPLPLMADESCHTSKDIEHCAKYFHMINIKQGKAGGITEAMRTINAAHNHGLKIMLGCFTETSISIAALAHISPLVDYADLDGSLLLAKDPYKINLFNGNQIVLPNRPGLGL